jgi:diaminohydroxyphosphoribosylaminopyrimidine deaminase/5-amino-6-(5-phosphoribosylamino)uracil reductase
MTMGATEQQRRDGEFMARALELASSTTALASPNPQVGCVIMRDGTILGEGAHLYDNYDHAEIVALKQAASRGLAVEGATAYVTLEPCSHHGRTGPCADALVTAGMARVVVATLDPNPMVSGRGIEKLRAAGIEVVIGVGEQEAREINEAFAHFIRTRTPFVTLKAALSADGKLAPAATSRAANEPFWLTGTEARQDVQRLRHAADAVLTGIGTVLADDPQLTDRSGMPRRRPLLRVVLDSYLRTPLSSKLVASAQGDLLLFAGDSAPEGRIEDLRNAGVEVEVIAEENGRLSLPFILSRLGERGILSLLLEGGSRLNGAFLRQNLVEKVILFHSQTVLGEHAIPFAEGIASPVEVERSLTRLTRTSLGQDVRVTGYLRDPWTSQQSSDLLTAKG